VALTGSRAFVGFGFGPIQAGLFLHEAFRSGAFGRLVVAEVDPELVAAVRAAGGSCSVNVAHRERVERAVVEAVEIGDPAAPADRRMLVEAIAAAEEIATAVPSVDRYVSSTAGSVHLLLAAGLRRKAARGGPRAVVYAAENHNHAAEILEEAVLSVVPERERAAVSEHVRFLNTVIGKMSRVVSAPEEVRAHGLVPLAPALSRAFLVEAFNRILISKIQFDGGFERGIAAFEEKDDLLPFEEAKLYGHNATHALGGYLGALAGVRLFADLDRVPGLLPFLRAAFVEESGETLIRRHRGADPLFTADGYAAYADDLLERMANPLLLDTIERVTRDPDRKLGWNDRLIGTIRLALGAGVDPERFAFGAAAGASSLRRPSTLESAEPAARVLALLWGGAQPVQGERAAVLEAVGAAQPRLEAWTASGFANLDEVFRSGNPQIRR
jgi:mannitol-1-phosphate 5-dehydrogenase